jgi:hypothetical protein
MAKILSISALGLQLLGFAIHIWTVLILFQLHGFFGSVVGFLAPVLSEIYLFIMSWRLSGVLLTQFNYYLILYIVGLIVWVVLSAIFTTE